MITTVLKEATRPMHEALEACMFSENILAKSLTPDQYRLLIQANYTVHALLENRVFTALSADVKHALQVEERAKLPALEADRHILSIPGEINLPAHIFVPGIHDQQQALGAMYVMEGATLGGNMIVRHLKKTAALAALSFHYYGVYGETTGEKWKRFQNVLNTYVSPDSEACVAKATEVFIFMQRVAQHFQQPIPA